MKTVNVVDKEGNLLTESDIDVLIDGKVKDGFLEQACQNVNDEASENNSDEVDAAINDITREHRI